ncbi:MAG: NHLP family bacteriocin export ABC transporter peptidase/permease/ATPase subunit [Anaerolineales bacterium]|nr:NHLP family bacteriocin export ABC transporter peptidase/permease/ATPase subunit [Anaerolineales bacterium]
MTVAIQSPANRLWRSLWGGRRHKTPTLLQMEATECGAAALGSIMEYYGRVVPLEELRQACGVSRNGSKASNILRAARAYGFEAKGYRRSPEKLAAGELPVIIFWNFNHFVVVEGFAGNRVYINDPAKGPRVVSYEEFDESFTGVVLTIRPGSDFQAGGRRESLVGALRQRLRGSSSALSFLFLATLCLTILGLVIPSFTRIFIDRILVRGLDSWILPLLIAMGVTLLFSLVLNALRQHYLLRLETKLAISGSSQFLWHVLRLPVDFFLQRRAADISVRVYTNDQLAQLLSGQVATNLLNVFLVLFYVLVMIQYDLLLTGVGVLIALLNMLVLRLIARRRVDMSHQVVNEQGKLTSVSYNGVQMIETLKATGREGDFFARWAGHQAKVINAQQKLAVSSELLAALPGLLLSINTALILVLGGLRIMAGELSLGELIAFQALVLSFLAPVNQLVSLGDRLQQTESGMNRVNDVLRYPAETETAVAVADSEVIGQKLSGRIEIRDLSFGYSQLDEPLIENFNLTLNPGARVALVGGSGSGKSTIAKLVAGIFQPWSGQILFDGQARADIPKTRLKNSLAMVDQDIVLIEGTIRQNLTMWDETIPDAWVVRAAKDAAIHEEISSRHNGYDHAISELGSNFSGGQRQRLEIARALANNPSILILDEATSALDPVTEKTIDNNLRRRGCACIIVAHRLSTIRDCDEIIVLENGRVVQRGTHDEMIRVDGPYARLIKAEDASQNGAHSFWDLL